MRLLIEMILLGHLVSFRKSLQRTEPIFFCPEVESQRLDFVFKGTYLSSFISPISNVWWNKPLDTTEVKPAVLVNKKHKKCMCECRSAQCVTKVMEVIDTIIRVQAAERNWNNCWPKVIWNELQLDSADLLKHKSFANLKSLTLTM